MNSIIKKIGLGISAFAMLALGVVGLIGNNAYADTQTKICEGVTHATGEPCNEGIVKIENVWEFAGQVTTWILIAVGIICVLFIIFGGIRYATSGGDPEKVKNAKNTLLYAIIGLAIALLAAVIVNLVTGASRELVG
ncbi:hypothetical protein FACS189431_2330 [Alphaproteobacteria bacterium]|nr:hypothetical protein FACS189431_2330 [Alphaproteobacteria bacterium]